MDLIDRNAVLKLPRNVTKNLSGEVIEETIDVDRIKRLPSAQPEVDEWCTDCKEYDIANHNCPRFNRVIRETVKEIQTERKKDIIQNFHDYQVEWLKSHNDIELEPDIENLIIHFLHDTANRHMIEMDMRGEQNETD